MDPVQQLVEFVLRDRRDAADWKDDAREFLRLAEAAKWCLMQAGYWTTPFSAAEGA